MTLSSNAVAAMFLSLAVATICATEVGEAAAASSAREIKGRVVGANGTPVSEAVVWVAPASTVRTQRGAINQVSRTETREDGSFVVKNLSGMLFALRIEAKGYAPFTRLETPAGSTVSITLGKGFSVSGVVRDRDTRAPILAASVLGCDREAARFGEAACVRAETEKDGRFTLAH